MSKNAINLATIGAAELDAMPVAMFTASLARMSDEAVARFSKMRKLSPVHRQALEAHLATRNETGGHRKAAAPRPAGPSLRLRLYAWWHGLDISDCKGKF